MASAARVRREDQLDRLRTAEPMDVLVIGGGATGVGIALDAATRGYRTAVCEQHDFGKGTSSRSTKLIHGGVRYLQQGNITLVRDALHERGLLRRNAPHRVFPLPTIVPLYSWWEPPYYRLGLWMYDRLAGKLGFGPSTRLSRAETLAELPTLRDAELRGGVRYFDAAFDDARLLIELVQTAVAAGAVCANYLRVDELLQHNGKITGVAATDIESQERLEISARVVVNAAGPFCDDIRRLEAPIDRPWIAPSQGIHVVLPREFMPSASALIVPKTSDGRVVFAIPWHEQVLVGTTDTPLNSTSLEPTPQSQEIDFLLTTIGGYLQQRPTRDDVLTTFAGIRPLVRGSGGPTSKLARDHEIRVSDAGLVSVLGGKWTTYRRMAADAVDRAAAAAGLPVRGCRTESLAIHNGDDDLSAILAEDPQRSERLDSNLDYTVADVVRAARSELAQTVEDVLARRLRALFIDARAAVRAAPQTASILAAELGRDDAWVDRQVHDFEHLAAAYLPVAPANSERNGDGMISSRTGDSHGTVRR